MLVSYPRRDRLDVARGAVWKDAVVDTILDRCDAQDASNVSDWVVRTSVAIEVDWCGCKQTRFLVSFVNHLERQGIQIGTNRTPTSPILCHGQMDTILTSDVKGGIVKGGMIVIENKNLVSKYK